MPATKTQYQSHHILHPQKLIPVQLIKKIILHQQEAYVELHMKSHARTVTDMGPSPKLLVKVYDQSNTLKKELRIQPLKK